MDDLNPKVGTARFVPFEGYARRATSPNANKRPFCGQRNNLLKHKTIILIYRHPSPLVTPYKNEAEAMDLPKPDIAEKVRKQLGPPINQ